MTTEVDRGRVATRALLIDVAERLFAERGVGAVALRQVGIEAGQRNNSAAQYHFGSRLGLVDAIVEVRSSAIDERRSALWEQVADAAPDERRLLEILVRPLAESLRTPSGQASYYLRFLTHAFDYPEVRRAWVDNRQEPATMRKVHRRLRQVCANLPDEDFQRRLEWTSVISLRILADLERQHAPGTPPPEVLDQVINEIVAMLTSLFKLQPSAARE